MALTRAINTILWTNTAVIQSLLQEASNPFVAQGFAEKVSFGGQWNFNGSSGPLAAEVWYGPLVLVSGALTIDLTALADGAIGTVNLNTKKMMGFAVAAPTTNAAVVSIKPGGTNGYTGWVGSGGLILNAGDQHFLGPMNAGTAISSSLKTIDLVGTGTDSLNVVILFG